MEGGCLRPPNSRAWRALTSRARRAPSTRPTWEVTVARAGCSMLGVGRSTFRADRAVPYPAQSPLKKRRAVSAARLGWL